MELAAGSYAVLTVSDNGHGIDPNTQAHIFGPFFTTKGGAGTGLGLATVHAIVVESAAHISVESQVETGTNSRFIFRQAPRRLWQRSIYLRCGQDALQERRFCWLRMSKACAS